MRCFLISVIFCLLSAAQSFAQVITDSMTFTQVANSPPYLNCAGRVEVGTYSGTVLMRGDIYIRDPTARIIAQATTGTSYSPSNPLVIATEYGTQNPDIAGAWSCFFSFDVIVDYGTPTYYSRFSTADVCPGERGTILAEYRDPTYGVTWVPQCAEIADSGGSANFTWNELNGGFSTGNPHTPYGHVKPALTTGLEATRTNYNRGGIRLSSGYRCPHGNAAVGGVTNSMHVHGRAADMYSASYTWTEDEFNLMRAAAATTGTAELLSWTTYADHHLHAAW